MEQAPVFVQRPVSPSGKIGAAVLAAAITLATPMIAHFEGTKVQTYRDPIGIATACTGHTGPEVQIGQTYTAAQCDALLSSDLHKADAKIDTCIKVPVNPNQLAAFLSFSFNAGGGAFCSSTMVKKLNARDYAGACAELSKWTFAGGQQLPGLVKRRAAERQLCETP